MMLQIVQRIGIPFILLLLGTAYFLEGMAGKPKDMMLIKPVFCLMVVLFCINAATDLRSILRNKNKDRAMDEENDSLKKIMPFAGMAILLVASLPFLGFLLSSLVFLFFVLLIFKVDNKAVLFVMPPVVSVSLYILFSSAFGVDLPVGFLGI